MARCEIGALTIPRNDTPDSIPGFGILSIINWSIEFREEILALNIPTEWFFPFQNYRLNLTIRIIY